jgi:hypothetical protein
VCSLRFGFQPYPQTLDYTRKNLSGVNTLAYFGTEGKKYIGADVTRTARN